MPNPKRAGVAEIVALAPAGREQIRRRLPQMR